MLTNSDSCLAINKAIDCFLLSLIDDSSNNILFSLNIGRPKCGTPSSYHFKKII